ncbi:MAG: hypothetical protein NZ898_04785 [Myxococcota bacterium]|nr:hypothetical protein [Myxococcota bacterium]
MNEPDDSRLESVRALFAGLYEVHGQLTWNGIALVYAATRAADGLRRALALLPLDCEADPSLAAAFEERARALMAIHDPHLLETTGFDVRHGVPFLEWELPEHARTLEERLRERPVDRETAVRVLRGVLRGLCAAHRAGIAHLDVGPTNVLLVERDGVLATKVVGLGVASLLGALRSLETTGPTGRASGPDGPRYQAPEVRERAGSARSDVYGAGALLWRMLHGEPPPRALPPDDGIDPLLALARRALEPDPAARPADARAMLDALDELGLVRPSVPPARTSTPPVVPSQPGHAPKAAPEPVGSPEQSGPTTERAAGGPNANRRPWRLLAGIVVLAVLLVVAASGAVRCVCVQEPPPAGATHVRTSVRPSTPSPRSDAAQPRAQDRTDASTRAVVGTPGIAHPAPAGVADTSAAGTPPWRLARPLPPELAALANRIEAGERLTREELGPLYVHASARAGGAAGQALLAHAFFNLRWYRDALDRYDRALRLEPALRDAPPLLDHVLRMTLDDRVGPEAVRTLERHWGAAARPVVERALAGASGPARARLQRLLARLGSG